MESNIKSEIQERYKKPISPVILLFFKSTILFFIIALILFFFNIKKSYALEPQVFVSGAGTSAVNGCYTDTGNLSRGTYPIFSNGTYYLGVNSTTYDADPLYWMFSNDPEIDSMNLYYTALANGRFGTYSVNSGSSPAPTVVETCDEEPPDPDPEPTATTTTASTTEMLGSIAFGMGIMLVLIGMFLTAYIWGTINRKKPWK